MQEVALVLGVVERLEQLEAAGVLAHARIVASRDQVGTQLAVTIRDAATSQNLWEGRADFRVADNSPLAQSQANAQTVAAALFSEFPGNNGETVEIEVSE